MHKFLLVSILVLFWACNKESKGPDCKFSSITNSSDTKLAVSYPSDTVVQLGTSYPGYSLYYNTQKKLIRREEPVLDPYYRSEMEYNASGQVSVLRFYSKQGTSWLNEASLTFTYSNGRLVNMREDDASSQPGHVYDDQINWKGNDIVSVEHRLNQQTQCTTQFSYDGSLPNPMRRFSPFYFVDGDANYANYKLPYYYSEHLVTKQESTCTLSETRQFSYTFTSTGLIESMTDHTGSTTMTIWEYEYECK